MRVKRMPAIIDTSNGNSPRGRPSAVTQFPVAHFAAQEPEPCPTALDENFCRMLEVEC